ncbi:DUF4232 domain-containing protein [Streptomyces kunmingensis]|uniref:DUF4232 domain-containing protein n=1 Tax=Streptomyces kunmingensis TaxID=68225 RepID=A0ABU6C385_9ACTN|nr:DUF4232 domain-containing protein [Streptomyces kunmingensis]MEB3959183.1 DUF4232 domain-containing protein [Streptomyces kunmingensis]
MKRTLTRTTVLATAAMVLGLTMTACSGGDDGGTKAAGSASAAGSSTSSNTDSGSGSGLGSGSGDAKASGGTQAGNASKTDATKNNVTGQGGTDTAASKSAPECKVTSLGYTLERKNPEQQGDHLLIIATNDSGVPCTVQQHPVVTPGDANGDVPLAKDDEQPAQPVLVQPGGTVYSALPVYQTVKAEDSYFDSLKLGLVLNDSDASGETVTLETPGEVEYAGKSADGIEVLSWNTRKPYDY